MTRSKILAMMLLLVGVFFINSCSDDDDDSNPINAPVVGNDFFKATEGDTWTYESFKYTKDGGIATEAESEYTITVGGKETVLEREAFAYTNNYGGTDKKQYYIPDGKILEGLVKSLIPTTLPFELSLNDDWVTIADLTKNEWSVYYLALNDLPITFNKIPAVVSGKIEIMGEVKGKEDVEVDGKTYSTQRIDMKYILTIDKAVIYGQTVTEIDKIEMVSSFYYAEGKGLLQTVFKPQEIKLSTLVQTVEGFVDKCKTMNVK